MLTEQEEGKVRDIIGAFDNGKSVTELNAATTLGDNDVMEVLQGGENKKVPVSVVKESVNSDVLTDLNKRGVFNVTVSVPLSAGTYYTLSTAIAAVPTASKSLGLDLKFSTSANTWVVYRYKGSDLSGWSTTTNWEQVPDAAKLSSLETDLNNLTVESDIIINLANQSLFNYTQYVSNTGYVPTASNTRCTNVIEVAIGDKLCCQGLGYTDVQLGLSGVRIGGYFDENMNFLQVLNMVVGSTNNAVDTIFLNSAITGGGFIDTVPNLNGVKYFVCNFVSSAIPTTKLVMVEKSDSLNKYVPYGETQDLINPKYLIGYVKKTDLDEYAKKSEIESAYTLKNDIIDVESDFIIENKILDNSKISMYDRGNSIKQYVSKKVGIIVAGQSNTQGRVPSANFPASYTDELGATVDYLDINNQIPLSKYCKNNINGTFSIYTKPSLWAYDAIVLSKLCHKLNDTVYMINYSLGGTAISVNGNDAGGFWTPRFEDIDEYNLTKPDTNTKLCALFEQSIRTAKSLDNNFEIRAFLWHQGEGDYMQIASEDYYKNFIEVISYIRGVVGNPTLPVIFGTISHNSAQYSSVVESAQIKIANEDPYAYVINMSTGTLLDAYHFDAVSTEYLGTEMYKIIRDSVLKL